MTVHRKSLTREICVECWKRWPCPAVVADREARQSADEESKQ